MQRPWRSETLQWPTAWSLAFLTAFRILTFACAAAGAAAQPLFNVGYQILDLKCQHNKQGQTLGVAVWYPTAAPSKPHRYGGPTEGNIAMGAAPHGGGGPFPFLVFSHGYGGSGIGAVFFTEALASHGWIVAAPDHNDAYSAVRILTGHVKDYDRYGLLKHAHEIAASGPRDRPKYLYRLDEMACALDGLLASDEFGKLIDRDRIAVGGHSLGGFTALGLCGTIPKRHDPRIRAVLLFSTGAGGYLFTEAERGAVKMPSMIFLGERERTRAQRRGKHTMADLTNKLYENLPPPKYMLEIKDAGHFSFNNRFDEIPFTRGLSGTEEQFDVIRRYSIAFLEKYVAGKKGSECVLERNHPLLTRYARETLAVLSEEDEEREPRSRYEIRADAERPLR